MSILGSWYPSVVTVYNEVTKVRTFTVIIITKFTEAKVPSVDNGTLILLWSSFNHAFLSETSWATITLAICYESLISGVWLYFYSFTPNLGFPHSHQVIEYIIFVHSFYSVMFEQCVICFIDYFYYWIRVVRSRFLKNEKAMCLQVTD